MKTKLIRIGYLVIGIVAIAYFVSAHIVGLVFEKKYKNFLAQQNGDIYIKIDRYQRGWLHSRAKITLEIVGPGPLKKFSPYTIEQLIQHGPIIYYPGHLFFGLAAIENIFQYSNVVYQYNGMNIAFRKMRSHFWIDPALGSMHIDSSFTDITAGDGNEFISIPDIKIKFSLLNLDPKSLITFIEAYREIMRRGELYQSQLRYKLSLLLPSLLNPRSRFSLDEFNITMPQGKIRMNGSVTWNKDEFSFPDNLVDLIDSAVLQMKLNISKSLMSTLIDMISELPLFDNNKKDQQQAFSAAHHTTQNAVQLNTISIISLVKEGNLSEQDAINLLSLQENGAPFSFYNDVVRELFLKKDITAETSYLLYWQYAGVQRSVKALQQMVKQYHQETVQDLHAELAQWLKQGYIIENKSDYIAFIVRDEGEIKLNGHVLK